MKLLCIVLVFVLGHVRALAGSEESSDLVNLLEGAVVSAAHGDLVSAVRAIDAQAPKPKNTKEINSQIDEMKAMYRKLAPLGELDSVERLSIVYAGDSFFRLRVVEKRAEGAILYTFVGYKLRATWFCKGMNFTANTDLLQLMKELDAADAKPVLDGKKP